MYDFILNVLSSALTTPLRSTVEVLWGGPPGGVASGVQLVADVETEEFPCCLDMLAARLPLEPV